LTETAGSTLQINGENNLVSFGKSYTTKEKVSLKKEKFWEQLRKGFSCLFVCFSSGINKRF